MGLLKQFNFGGLETHQEDMRAAKYMALLVTMTGTNASGQTAGFKDIGNLIISRNDNPIVTREFQHFADMNDIRGGKFTLDSEAGAKFEAATMIPFFEKGHPNVLDINTNEKFNLEFNPANTGALSDVELEVWGITDPALIQRYNYRIGSIDESFVRAETSKVLPINKRNVSALYIDDLDDIVKSFSFESNGETVSSTASPLVYRALTNANNRIEQADQRVIEIENHTPGLRGTLLNRNNSLTFSTTGAGGVDITVCSVEPTQNFNR